MKVAWRSNANIHSDFRKGARFSVVFLRLVMQDATRAVFDVFPEV